MLSASSEMDKIKAQYLLGVVLSGGANLLGMGASLLTIMVAARLLSQEELGSFFLLLLVAQVTALFGISASRTLRLRLCPSYRQTLRNSYTPLDTF